MRTSASPGVFTEFPAQLAGLVTPGRYFVYSNPAPREMGSIVFQREDSRLILDHNERPMVCVHECWNDNEADVVVSVLRAYGIEALANSEVPHSIMPLTANGLGKVSVLVGEETAVEARKILASFEGEVDGEKAAQE